MTEAPILRVETRYEIVALLYEAAELEHGLVCSYLFTAFSLKDGETDGLTADQARAVAAWRDVIVSVALEEMLHLTLVSNLLTALGAAPHLRRPTFPQVSSYYPAGITIELRRLTDATITRFIHLERPEGVDVEEEVLADPGIDLESAPEAGPAALRTPEDEDEVVPSGDFFTVGHLYQAIEDGICHLVERRGEADVFIGPPGAQATTDYFHFPGLVAVTDLASAREAVEVLVTQGEGVRGDWTDAHYGKFLRVREELRELRAQDPDFDPSRPVLDNPLVHEPPGGAPERVVEDPHAVAVMELFDNCYDLMTAMLGRFFAHSDEADDALTALVQTAIGLMSTAVRPLGGAITTMPAGGAHGGATAGPAFELRPVSLIAHRRAAWLGFHERLVELAAFAGRLADEGAPAVLAEVAATLTGLAHDLEPYLERAPLLEAPDGPDGEAAPPAP